MQRHDGNAAAYAGTHPLSESHFIVCHHLSGVQPLCYAAYRRGHGLSAPWLSPRDSVNAGLDPITELHGAFAQ